MHTIHGLLAVSLYDEVAMDMVLHCPLVRGGHMASDPMHTPHTPHTTHTPHHTHTTHTHHTHTPLTHHTTHTHHTHHTIPVHGPVVA